MAMVHIHDIVCPHRSPFSIAPIAAATATQGNPIFAAPFTCKVRKVVYYFGATVTGQATHYFNLNLFNRGTDGSGTTELANRDYASGTNDTAFVAREVYAPATYLSVATGVVLDLQRELVGTGLAMPAVWGYVEYEGA